MYGLEDEELKKMCAPNNLKTDAEEDHCKTINELKSCQNLLGEGQKKFAKYKKRNFCLRALFIAAFIGVIAICYVFRPLDLCFGKDGKPGKCLEIFQCPFFLTEIKEGKEPVICEYNKKKLKVCCFDEDKVPDIGSRHIIPAQENEVEAEEDYKIVFKEPLNGKLPKIQDSCKPLTNYTKSGRKSFQKCLEYQDKYVYPCQESLTPNGGMVRMDHCNSHNPESLIIDGDEAFFGEFPHMALLGYDTNTDVWQCDGFIVSENFILTAGHCTFSPHGGKVTKVRIGFLRKSEEIKEHLLYKVKKIHKFPGYNPLQHYHDIALIETDRPMALNRNALPACLHDGSPIDDSKVTAVGWGATDIRGRFLSDTLLKVTLEKFTHEECSRTYSHLAVRKMPQGFNNNTQICYGDRMTSKDTNRGDSGGPTQIRHPDIKCMYLVNSIINSGKHLGMPGSPGLYTRIAPYIDWIERTVWP